MLDPTNPKLPAVLVALDECRSAHQACKGVLEGQHIDDDWVGAYWAVLQTKLQAEIRLWQAYDDAASA